MSQILVGAYRAFMALAVALFVTGAALAQEKTPQDPRLHTPGKLTVATSDPAYPPWVLNNAPESGEGFESALVYALAKELGFGKDDVVWVRETFEQSIAPGKKNYDFGIQQISVTEARAQIATFSQVYYQPDKALVALPGGAADEAETFDELRKLRWGVALGTTDLTYVENILGVKDAAVYDDQVGVFQALQARQIDATVVAVPTALYLTAVQVPDARITALLPGDENDLGHGLIFQQGNPIVGWIDEGLAQVIGKNVVDDLVHQYLVADPSVKVINE
jgi:polar amino acid transport system substrate-binding protein